MGFEWITPPDVFNDGLETYTITTFAELFDLCVHYADLIQTAMRLTAPWADECMPGKEYLRAEAFYPDQWSVGIRAWYDLELYRQTCGEPPTFDWSWRHETQTFGQSGVISVILPRGETEGSGQSTVLGTLADQFWDAVRALYA